MSTWSAVKLGELLATYTECIDMLEPRLYPKLSVKLYGKGVELDTSTHGALLKMKRHQIARAGQVILSEIWGKKGAIGIVPPEGEGALCTSHFFLFDIRKDRLEPRWLQQVFKANYLEEQLNSEARGTTGYAAVRPKHLLNASIPLPPLSEQRRLVVRIEELAGKVAEAHVLRLQTLQAAEAIGPSFLSQVLDYVFPDPLPPRWMWRSFNELLTNDQQGITTGPFGTLLSKGDIQPYAGVAILGIANVGPDRLIPGFVDHISQEKAEALSNYRLMPNDIVIARSGTVGRSCVVPESLEISPVMSTNLIRVRVNNEVILPDLLSRLFNGSKLIERHKEAECRGSSRSFFTQKILSRLKIPTPPIDEQSRIVSRLLRLQERVDVLKRLQEGSSVGLDALLPSILNKAFKGELPS